MTGTGSIILKELLQAAHRRRTYALRAALSGLMVVIATPWLAAVLFSGGTDWRAIAQVARPLFSTLAWIQLLALSVLGAVYADASLQEEWTRRTMELLCTTPVTTSGIVWGKFAGALGKVLFMAVAALPVMAVGLGLGGLPREVALRTAAVIFSSAVCFAALALAGGAAFGGSNRRIRSGFGVVAVYVLVVGVLMVSVADWHAVAGAALPPWAFHHVISATAPLGITPGWFAVLAIGEPLVVGAIALAVAPLLFRRSLARHVSAGRQRRRPLWTLSKRLRRISRRPALGDEEDPFEWQERGAPTRMVTWVPTLLYLSVAIMAIAIATAEGIMSFLSEPVFSVVMAVFGAFLLTLVTLMSATHVFSREKARNTAASLILTGRPSKAIYRAKIRALARALRLPWLVIGCSTLAGLVYSFSHGPSAREQSGAALGVLAGMIFMVIGPLVAGVIGMVFGAGSRSATHALAGVLLSPMLGWILGMVFGVLSIFAFGFLGAILSMGCIVALYRVKRVWKVWSLSLMLALTLAAIPHVLLILAVPLAFLGERGRWVWFGGLSSVVSIGMLIGLGVFWYTFGARVFEASMLGEPTQSRRRPLRTALPIARAIHTEAEDEKSRGPNKA